MDAEEYSTDGDMEEGVEEGGLLTQPEEGTHHNDDTVNIKMRKAYGDVVRQGNGTDQDGGIEDDNVW